MFVVSRHLVSFGHFVCFFPNVFCLDDLRKCIHACVFLDAMMIVVAVSELQSVTGMYSDPQRCGSHSGCNGRCCDSHDTISSAPTRSPIPQQTRAAQTNKACHKLIPFIPGWQSETGSANQATTVFQQNFFSGQSQMPTAEHILHCTTIFAA